jgi:hypothetical protein
MLLKKLPKTAILFVSSIPRAEQKRQQFLAKHKMAVFPHPPYSPDLAPCDFFPFPKMKFKLKGRRFDTIEEIQVESQRLLATVSEKDLQEAFQKWRRRLDRCLREGGNYFEGDGDR